MDNQTVIESGFDMASRMDRMINMLLDLNNKVNDQGKDPAVPLESSQPGPVKARPETSRSRYHNTLFLDVDVDETVR